MRTAMVRDFAVLVIVLVLLLPCLHYLYTFGSGRGKKGGEAAYLSWPLLLGVLVLSATFLGASVALR
jgi:hypothetical protein